LDVVEVFSLDRLVEALLLAGGLDLAVDVLRDRELVGGIAPQQVELVGSDELE